jgi:RHS repeat-associated protein
MSTDAYGNVRSDQFAVTAGQGFDVAAWIWGEVDVDDSRDGAVWIVRVRWEDLNGTYLSYSNAEVGSAANGLPSSFAEKGGTVTAPVGAVFGRVEIYFYLASGWLNVDDVSVTPTTTVNVSETLYYSFGGDTIGMRVDGVLSWIFSDQLGSTGITYKADGSGTSRQFYYSYGGIRNPGGAAVVDTDVGFTGQRLDETTGLMFYQARYYDPLTARFISADTIVPDPGNPQDFNRYTYVRNNPVTCTDPSGNCSRVAKSLENIYNAETGGTINLGSGDECPDSFTLWGDVRNIGTGIIDTPANVGNSLIRLDDFIGSGLDDALDRYYAEAAINRPDSFWFPTLGPDPGYGTEYLAGAVIGPAAWLKGFQLGGAFASRLAARFGTGTTRVGLHPTFELGPFAGDSIPASGTRQPFTAAERAQINRIGQQSGCHTCGTMNPGTKSGNFVPDHQPVSALNLEAVPQRLFPQSISCSRAQGLATARTLQQLRQLSGGGI